MYNIASIDIGSMTARLLIGRKTGSPEYFKPLCRKRSYIRLADGFNDDKDRGIKREAVDRTLSVLDDFASIITEKDVKLTLAAATGVVREARNSQYLLDRVYRNTGIRVKVLSGEQEAGLSALGVAHSFKNNKKDLVIFDLGGGTTEFIFGDGETRVVKSLPIGVLALKQRFLKTDPPTGQEIEALSGYVGRSLSKGFPGENFSGTESLLVGTGGTVTALAAMVHSVETEDIDPDLMNGLKLEIRELEGLFGLTKKLTLIERSGLTGLDRNSADVILAGAATVIGILDFFGSHQVVVSLSDILEGILIDHLRGEQNA